MSHFIRTTLVSHLIKELDLKRKEDILKEAYPPRIRKDKKHLSDILEFFASCNNPFDVDCRPRHLNTQSKDKRLTLLRRRKNNEEND